MVDFLVLLWSAATSLFRSREGLRRKSWFFGSRSMCCGALPQRDLVSALSTDWCSLSYIASFLALSMRCPSSGPRPWFAGTVLDFDRSGVGNPDGAAGDRESRWRSVR